MTLIGRTRTAPWDGSFTAVYRDANGQYFAAHGNYQVRQPLIQPITPEQADSWKKLFHDETSSQPQTPETPDNSAGPN